MLSLPRSHPTGITMPTEFLCLWLLLANRLAAWSQGLVAAASAMVDMVSMVAKSKPLTSSPCLCPIPHPTHHWYSGRGRCPGWERGAVTGPAHLPHLLHPHHYLSHPKEQIQWILPEKQTHTKVTGEPLTLHCHPCSWPTVQARHCQHRGSLGSVCQRVGTKGVHPTPSSSYRAPVQALIPSPIQELQTLLPSPGNLLMPTLNPFLHMSIPSKDPRSTASLLCKLNVKTDPPLMAEPHLIHWRSSLNNLALSRNLLNTE